MTSGQKKSSKDPFEIETAELTGGISGFTLPVESYSLLPSLTLRRTYAHLIAPFLLAMGPPIEPNRFHRGPWVALGEGGISVYVELQLDAQIYPLGFDRVNTVWFVVALLRLRSMQPIQLVVLCDRSFATIKDAPDAANLLPVEVNLRQLEKAPSRKVTIEDLDWIKANISSADELMKDDVFNRAMLTLDRAIAIRDLGAGIVIAWASIETLFRPGKSRITSRICRALAAFLAPAGPERDRLFTIVSASYEARGGVSHAGEMPEIEQFQIAFGLARDALIKAIEQSELPNIDDLLENWRAGN